MELKALTKIDKQNPTKKKQAERLVFRYNYFVRGITGYRTDCLLVNSQNATKFW
jgi:hypothetical protein